jgi:hypothetical protein
MLPIVSCQDRAETLFKVSGVKLSSMSKRILRELEGFQLAIEVLKSQGFSGSSCWLGVRFFPRVVKWNLQILESCLEARYWRRPLISILQTVDKSIYASVLIGTSNFYQL